MHERKWRNVGRALVPGLAAGGLVSGASATTPSMFAADYNRVVVSCSGLSPQVAAPLCDAVAAEMRTRTGAPVVIGATPAKSDIVVNLGCASQCEGAAQLNVALWLSRPVGRNGEPATRPVRTALLEITPKGRLANADQAIARLLDQAFGTRQPRGVPPPPRAQ